MRYIAPRNLVQDHPERGGNAIMLQLYMFWGKSYYLHEDILKKNQAVKFKGVSLERLQEFCIIWEFLALVSWDK